MEARRTRKQLYGQHPVESSFPPTTFVAAVESAQTFKLVARFSHLLISCSNSGLGIPLRANIFETVLVLLINEQGGQKSGQMNSISLGVPPSGVLAGAERSEGEGIAHYSTCAVVRRL